MSQTVTRTLTIVNVKGLHARASAKLAELVERFDAEAEVSKDGLSALGDSIMGLLMLGASSGTTIDVTCRGAAASDLANAIEGLVANRFGEDM
jgi:phosphocarrier protein